MGNEQTLGEFLRQERERRGITIEQVASATKVGVRILHSLESNQYSDLPAAPFVRGFVSSYARFIGLEPKEILTRWGNFIDLKSQNDRPSREAGHSGYAFEKREGDQTRTVLWVVLGGFVIVGGIAMAVFKPSLKHSRKSEADKLRTAHAVTASPSPKVSLVAQAASPVPVAPLSSPSPSVVPSPVVETTTTVSAPDTTTTVPSPVPSVGPSPDLDPLNSGRDLKLSDTKIKIVVRALDDVWVRFKVDEKPVMKFILREDRILVLKAREKIRFQVNDPSDITFNFNGRSYPKGSDYKGVTQFNETATYFFPPTSSKPQDEPFPAQAPLPDSVPPPPNR